MFAPGNLARIWLCTQPTDMRKSFQGLSALVKNQLDLNPLSGQYFVFVNRRKTHMKVLYFEPSGYCLWSKRLEQGQFRVSPSSSGQRALSWTDLQLILDGVEVQKTRQYKRYQHPM
ncbi:IS66 family insertion sequence element accessory protein TnpB [Nitrincola sp. MINF-07-Sa-05]|uniref:IS66 family insertion sequence element accessory protein TnpB n=1 Tax=Nitrincola salilacus TaxID=3400273 RepID=UPI0039185DE6